MGDHPYLSLEANMVEQLANRATNSATAIITSGTTSIVLNDGSSFPASGDFRVVLESPSTYELVLCTARVTDTLTVTRAQEGTSAVEHPPGTVVTHTITPGGLVEFLRPSIPALQDGISAAHFRNINNELLTSASFTWANQGTATRQDNSDGSISVFAPGNVAIDELRLQTKSTPSLGWKLTTAIIPTLHFNNAVDVTPLVGIGVRDSAVDRLWLVGQAFQNAGSPADRHIVADYNAVSNGFVSNFAFLALPSGRNIQYFQIEHAVGGDVTFRSSVNGQHWRDLTTQNSVSAGRTFDEMFWFVSAGDHATASNQFDTYGTLVAWSEENA